MRSGYWQGRRVCVTGGTGFLGYQLVRFLCAGGARVRVLALPPRRPHPLRDHADVEMMYGNVCEDKSVRRALAGAEVVFHAAGFVGVWGKALEAMRAVHVEGTRNVLQAAPPSARVVHTSSIVAIGASERGRELLDEDDPITLDDLDLPYVQAKRQAEDLALAAARSGQDVVVTNPAFLVGPEDYDRSAMGRLCLRFWRGRIWAAPPGGLNLADVRDVARGHLLAAEHGLSGRRYILGGENQSFTAFFRLLAQAGGFRPRAMPRWPGWALTSFAGLAELMAWFTGREPYPSLASARLNRRHWYCRSDRARRELGYSCRPLLDSLGDAHAWFQLLDKVRLRGFNRWWMKPTSNPALPRECIRVKVARLTAPPPRRQSVGGQTSKAR